MANRIPQSFIRDLIDRTDIVDVVRPRVELKKKGQNHHARCPFHEEKTPSFTVSENKQFYYCFGCGAHGNVLDFIMNYDRMEFREAIEYLANINGLDVPTVEGHTVDRSYDALFPILAHASKYYRQQLSKNRHAIDYLKNRGLSGETAKCFGVGFAPTGWDNLIKALCHDPKTRSYLLSAGMLIERDGSQPYDRFRNRIMFPIHDLRGRVIAFGGRTMGDDQPKYLNSPETPVFHKSQELYGLYQARHANQSLPRLLVVEGYMDVVSLFQHGITYAVATLGTAVNLKHLQKCLRFSDEIVFCFDGDAAGRKAAWKALTLSMPGLRDGIQLKFLFLPESEDPDSLVKKIGKDDFEKLIADASALQDVFFDELKKLHPGNSAADKAAYAKTAKKYISQMPQGIYQELLYDELAKQLQVTRQELEQVQQPRKITTTPANKPKPQAPIKISKLTQHCMCLLLQEPRLATLVSPPESLNDGSTENQLLLKLMLIFSEHPELPVGQLLSHWDNPEQQALIAKLAAKELIIDRDGYETEFRDTLNTITKHDHQNKINRLITKSKNTPLTKTEKTTLAKLLTYSVPHSH